MSTYAYPYDPSGSNPECVVSNESHPLVNYPNEWRCIIPLYAPFYRKDLVLRIVETGRILYEGIDYYLGHYYKEASEATKLPVFGSIMFLDKTSTATVEFVTYQTLGGRYNTLQRVIDAYLSKVDLKDPRNEDWNDVTLAVQSVAPVEAPENYLEARSDDPVTKALTGVKDRLRSLVDAQATGYDDVIESLSTLATRIADHDIARHHTHQGVHNVTLAQLGALGKDATAKNALKAYGYSLSQLAELINGMTSGPEDLDRLFKLVGDTLTGELRLQGENVLIKNSSGTSVINLANGNLQIIAESGVSITSDTGDTTSGIPVGLRAGDNLLTVHPDTGDFTVPVAHSVQASLVHPDAVSIAPTANYQEDDGVFAVYKNIYFNAGVIDWIVSADDEVILAIDGIILHNGDAYPANVSGMVEITEGYHWVSMVVTNSAGHCRVNAAFDNDGSVTTTDTSWTLLQTTLAERDDAVYNYPTVLDDNVVYNGVFVIHAGNVAQYVPASEYSDTYLHVEPTDTVELMGRGIEESPLFGAVTLPVASTAKNGVFKLSSSIYSGSKTLVATASAVRAIMLLADGKLDDTATINGKRLNNDITLTKADLGLGNVNNTAPADKPVSTAFTAAIANKSPTNHTHSAEDFGDVPAATNDSHGSVKLTTTVSDSTTLAATPIMLAEVKEGVLSAEVSVGKSLFSTPFDIMQYGGFGYLPVPVLGKYGAAGLSAYRTVGLIETNGDLVLLRNGADLSTSGVYYWYVSYKADGSFGEPTATTTEYLPEFIPAGQTVATVQRGTEGVFLLQSSNDDIYVVLTRNTMDSDKHAGAKIGIFDGFNPLDNASTCILWKDKVVFTYQYSGDSGLKFSIWTCDIADIESGGPLTLTAVKTTCDRWDGTKSTAATSTYFTNVGKSSDPDDFPFLLTTVDSGWTTVQTRRGVNSPHLAISGNRLRMALDNRPWVSNSQQAKATAMVFSWVLDLETMHAVFDGDNFPYTIDSTGFVYKDSKVDGWPFPNVGSGSTLTTISSRGKQILVRYHNATSPPFLRSYEDKNGLSHFDSLDNSVGDYTLIDLVYISGSYGSVVKPNAKQMGWIGEDRFVCRQIDNSSVIVEVDTDGHIEGTDSRGFGLTANRQSITTTEYYEALRVPMLWDTVKQSGGSLSLAVMSWNTEYANDTPSGNMFWTNDTLGEATTAFRAIHPVEGTEILFGDRVMFHMFGTMASSDMFVAYTRMQYTDDAKTRRTAIMYYHRCTITNNGDEVTRIIIGDEIGNKYFANNVTSWNTFEDFGQNSKVTLDDGNTLYIINKSHYVNWVGYGGGLNMSVIYSPSGEVLWTNFDNEYSPVMYGSHYHPKLGFHKPRTEAAGEALRAVVYGKTLAEITSGTSYEVIIHSTQVATGLILYFTEVSRFFVNGNAYELPVQSIDLSTYGVPYANETLYLYVVLATDADGNQYPEYVISATQADDTELSLFIGTVTCDDSTITDINVQRATRLGEIYELEEHANTVDAHGKDFLIGGAAYGLGNLKNMGMLHTLQLPTFKDVFNNWIRLSHLNTNDTQPAKESELDTWKYDEVDDIVSNDTNTTTFVGLASKVELGDGVFDTIIGSSTNDDDSLVIILAYKVGPDGREKTICAVATRTIKGVHTKTKTNFDIWYNYHQSDAILLANSIKAKEYGGWNGNFLRIRSEREGNIYTVTETPMKTGTTIADHPIDDTANHYTFTLDDYPELSVFKDSASFGYGAMSQPGCQYYNIQRPDEDVSNYYASAEMVRVMYEALSNTVRHATGVVSGGKTIPTPFGFTEDDCEVVLSYESSGSTTEVRYMNITLKGMVANMDVGYVGSSEIKTNPSGSSIRYYLIARKNAEV